MTESKTAYVLISRISLTLHLKNEGVESLENKAAVSFRHITKAFGSKVVANKDVSMDIMRGEILALLGENGSGKTTLMNMLSGIYRQDSGEIFVNGEEVHINSPKDAYA